MVEFPASHVSFLGEKIHPNYVFFASWNFLSCFTDFTKKSSNWSRAWHDGRLAKTLCSESEKYLSCWWFRNPRQPPGMYKTLKKWEILHVNWCRTSSINSLFGEEKSIDCSSFSMFAFQGCNLFLFHFRNDMSHEKTLWLSHYIYRLVNRAPFHGLI